MRWHVQLHVSAQVTMTNQESRVSREVTNPESDNLISRCDNCISFKIQHKVLHTRCMRKSRPNLSLTNDDDFRRTILCHGVFLAKL
jgi:hypothetical protein